MDPCLKVFRLGIERKLSFDGSNARAKDREIDEHLGQCTSCTSFLNSKISKSDSELMDQSEKLYDQYGTPLEQAHWGEYVAIFPDGRTLIGENLLDVSDEALVQFGQGSFLFKIGEKAVGKWR